MTPEIETSLTELEVEVIPSLTYGIDFDNGTMVGMIDNLDAVYQFVRKALSTERYGFVIYSSQYGSEKSGLIGKDFDYVSAEIERITKDVLLVDDRILSISDFVSEKTSIDTMSISFTVNSIYGDVAINTGVNL